MSLEKKPISLAKTKSFILAYLQEHGIIRVLWGRTRRGKERVRLAPHEPIALYRLEKEGYVEQVFPELPIWDKFPYRKGHLTHHHYNGYAYKITETGQAKKLRKNLKQTDEYRDWLADHLNDDENYQSKLRKIEQRAEELQTMPYQEYLETEEWKAIRAIVIERANYECQRCGKEDEYTLHAHHKKYSSRRGYENLDDLIALCGKCHALLHGKPLPT